MVLFETFVLEYLYSKQYQSREKLEIINTIRFEITCGPRGGGGHWFIIFLKINVVNLFMVNTV